MSMNASANHRRRGAGAGTRLSAVDSGGKPLGWHADALHLRAKVGGLAARSRRHPSKDHHRYPVPSWSSALYQSDRRAVSRKLGAARASFEIARDAVAIMLCRRGLTRCWPRRRPAPRWARALRRRVAADHLQRPVRTIAHRGYRAGWMSRLRRQARRAGLHIEASACWPPMRLSRERSRYSVRDPDRAGGPIESIDDLVLRGRPHAPHSATHATS